MSLELTNSQYKLEDICLQITDGKHGDCENQENSGYYFVSVKDIDDGVINYSNARQITKFDFEDTDKRTKLENEDILITNSGTIGKFVFVNSPLSRKTTFQKSVAIIKPNKNKIIPKFLYYYLISEKRRLVEYAGGTTQKNLLLRDIRNFEVEIPDETHQKKIIEILNNIDQLISVNKKLNRNLVNLAKTIFRDKFIFYKGYESQMIKTDVGEIPNTFEVKSVDEISKDVVCGKTPSTKVEENYGDKMLFITIPDMHGNVFVIDTERKLSEIGIKSQIKKILPENSICVSCIATAGLVSLTSEESQTNQQINSIICKEDISPYFIYLYMDELSEYIKMLGSGGSTTLNLNKREFGKIELVIPPKDDMIKFHGQISPFFEKIKSNQYEINFLSKLRDTLLPKLMSGEIDVSKINCDMQQISTKNWDNKFTVPLQNNLIKVIS